MALLQRDGTHEIETLRRDMIAHQREVTRKIEALRSEVARDMIAHRSEVAREFEALRMERAREKMANDRAQMERRMTIRLGGLLFAGGVMILAAIGIATSVVLALH